MDSEFNRSWRPGEYIAQRFQVISYSSGGMGVVYLCRDIEQNDRLLALKTFKTEILLSKSFFNLFFDEAALWIAMDPSPYVVTCYYFTKLDGKYFMILEYIDSYYRGRPTLNDVFEELSLENGLKIAIQICYGMEHVYRYMIKAHGDLKPNNILINKENIAKITDFGISNTVNQLSEEDIVPELVDGRNLSVFRSASGLVCGTPAYMSPERYDGFSNHQSDIYSFGIILFQIASGGLLPFETNDAFEYESFHRYLDVPELDSALFPVIKKCLNKLPKERYSSFEEIRTELQSLLKANSGSKYLPTIVRDLSKKEICEKAHSLINLGHSSMALAIIDSLLSLYPDILPAWQDKAQALWQLEKYDEAIIAADKAISLNDKEAYSWLTKGLIFEKLHQYEQAVSCCERALLYENDNIDGLRITGRLLVCMGRVEEAIAYFDRALKIDERLEEVWRLRGHAFYLLHKVEDAQFCYAQVININPYDFDTWKLCVEIYLDLSEYEDTLTVIDVAQRTDSSDLELWIQKTIALIFQGQYEKAKDSVRQALLIETNNASVIKLQSLLENEVAIKNNQLRDLIVKTQIGKLLNKQLLQ